MQAFIYHRHCLIRWVGLILWFLSCLTGCNGQFSRWENAPPKLQPIPDQIIAPGHAFTPISLDDYVEDETADSAITWTISAFGGNIISEIQNRTVYFDICSTAWRGLDTMQFTACDIEGLSASVTAVFGVQVPADGEVRDPDGRLRIFWESPEACDSRVLYWAHTGSPAYVASRRKYCGLEHEVRLLELQSNERYDYFRFGLNSVGDTVYQSSEDSFLTAQVSPAELLRAHFIDVKQGDACFIQTAGDVHLLIDGGYGSLGNPAPPSWDGDGTPRALNYLESLNVQQIDWMIKTHNHTDHYGGLQDIIYSGMTILEKQAPFPGDGFSADLAPGGILDLDAYTRMEILNCGYPPGIPATNENNSSIVLRLTYGLFSLLMTGDAETPVNEYLLRNFAGSISSAALKVNHHGSADATNDAWIGAVMPQAAVISCGAGNPYGHPHTATLNLLQTHAVEIFRTDLHGDITVVSDGTENWVWIYTP
jgi:competence protein ComEC